MYTEEIKKVLNLGRLVLIILFVFLLAQSLNAFKEWRTVDVAFNSISITGVGEAVSVPDIATFSFGVSADSKSVSDAQASVTKNTDAILAGLKDLGVEEKDIKTTDYSVYPKYIYSQGVCTNMMCPPSRQIPDGYTVSQSVSVKIRKTADAGKALAVAGDNGASNISGLNFTTDDPDKSQNEARAEAIKDAKMKAQTLAKSLGVRIVRVVGYTDNYSSPMPMYASYAGGSMMKDSERAPTIPVGESKTTANVTVTYEIR
jgi:uncharacterized protein YggE